MERFGVLVSSSASRRQSRGATMSKGRPVSVRKDNLMKMYHTILALVLGIVLLGLGLQHSRTANALHSGARAKGKVESVWKEAAGGRAGMNYNVSYRYKAESSTYFGEQQVTREEFYDLKKGAAVPVVYNRSNPSEAGLGTPQRLWGYKGNGGKGLVIFGGLLSVFSFVGMVFLKSRAS